MFRKKPELKPSSNLKSSERRKLLSSVCQVFGIEEKNLDAETKGRIVPKDIRSAKMLVHSGEKAILYSNNDGQPVWIALQDGYLIPTLYTSWEAPFLLQRVCTVKYTLERLQNGADLMIPGIFDPLPEKVPAGTVVAICLIDSPTVPVAIGISLIDCSEGKLDTNQKGKAVQLINVIDDKLFQSYRKKVAVPKELDVSIPEVVEVEEKKGEDISNEISKLKLEDQSSNSKEEESVKEKVELETEDETDGQQIEEQIEDLVEEHIGKVTEDQDDNDGQNNVSSDSDGTPAPSIQEIDDAFRRALLQTLRKAIDTPIETPIPSSTLLSNYVLLNLPYNHPHVQMKKTSWKKAAKFFKTMEKQSLLKGKERGGEFIITSLAGKDNSEVKNFEIFKPRPFEQHKQQTSSSNSSSSNKKTYLNAKEYFKPRSMAAPLFTSANLNPSSCYSAENIRQVLMKYVDKNSLVDKSNPKLIRLDRTLTKAFGLSPTIETVGRDKIGSLLQSNCSQFHSITSQNEDLNRQTSPTLAKGPIPKINITTEKRGGRKIVTNITNIEAFHFDPVSFAEELRISCAGSTSINPIREGSDLQQVMIQGNHVITITKLLESKGIRPTWIETVDKFGGSKKK